MFKRLRKNGNRAMSIVEYGILIAVIATVASKAFPYLTEHLLGNTQKQVERLPSYTTWQHQETNSATRQQQVVEMVNENPLGPIPIIGGLFDSLYEEKLKSAALVERKNVSTGFGRGPGAQKFMDTRQFLTDISTDLNLNDAR